MLLIMNVWVSVGIFVNVWLMFWLLRGLVIFVWIF